MLRNSKGCQAPQSTNLTEIFSKDCLPKQGQHITNTPRKAVTAVEENTLHQIADFVNQSTGFARRYTTSKKSAILSPAREGQENTQQTHNLSVEDTAEGDEWETSEEYTLYNNRSSRAPMMVTLRLYGSSCISMELNTGARISIMSKQTYNQLWRENKELPLQPSSIHLNTYTGKKLPVVGVTDIIVEYKQQSEMLQLHVVDGSGPSLIGRD